MIDKTRAEILQIRDLKAILFFSLDNDFKKIGNMDLLGLSVVYGDDKNLKLDYTSPYFKFLVAKVLDVYNEEKDRNNILLLNELTEKLIAGSSVNVSTDNFSNSVEKNITYQNKPIFNLASRNNDLIVAKTYVKEVIKNIAPFFFGDEELCFGEIKGYQNRYFISCNSWNWEYLIPFKLKKSGKNDFSFKITDVNNTSEVVEGIISIDGISTIIKWNIENHQLFGQEIFRINNFHERSIYNFNKIVDFENSTTKIEDVEKKVIDFYFDILGIERFDNGIKIADDKFLLGKNETDGDNIVTEKGAHVYLSKELINIVYANKFGLSKYDNNLVMPISEEFENITILALMINDKRHILIQRRFEVTDKMRGDYEEKANKYNYQLLEVNQGDSLLDVSTILKEYLLDDQFNSIREIKEYVKKVRCN